MAIDSTLTDEAVLEELGARLRRTRLHQNRGQAKLAEEAGVSEATIRNLEAGRPSQVVTLVRVLRVLGLLDDFGRALPEPSPSPLEQLRRQGRKRQRASSPRSKP
jgi:transcriptional regulator with XRE-family HTH domain